jgi:outer membrane protein assembly factor BamB
VQLLRALFPNPGGGELHLLCWDQGIENGYQLWSWTRHDDFIYFPQLAVGDANGDGRDEVLMLSQMCVWMFDARTGNEISRMAWGKRTRSYGGHFGLWPMKPGGVPGILVVSAYNKLSVIDCDQNRLVLRWDHAFEPGVGDQDLKGQVQGLQDGVCDVDGDGWAEIVCNQYAGYGDQQWRTVILSARDGAVLAELVGKVMVGAADVDGDGKAELFLQDRVHEHDPVSGRVTLARWEAGKGLVTIWTAPSEGTLVREPNDHALGLCRHPTSGDRVKLATGSRQGVKAFFIRGADGRTQAYEATGDGFRTAAAVPPLDPALPLSGLSATQSQPMPPPLVVDWDGDGTHEIVQRTVDGRWTALKAARRGGSAEPAVVGTIEGVIDSPIFADMDGDGRAEMVAVRMGDSEGPGEVKQQPCLEVSRADVTRLWRRAWPADYPYKFTPYKPGFAIMAFSVGRFTGKNSLDVVVCFTGEKAGGHTAVLDGRTGKTVWDIEALYPGMYGSCWDFNPPVVFDYDGDGLDDLATVCQTVHYTVLRGKDGKQLIDKPRDTSSQNFGGELPLFPKGWCVGAMLGGADIDGDGRPELGVFSSQACVGVTRANGEQLWFLDLPVVRQVPSPGCWADVDGDGRAEAVFIFKDGFVRVYDGMTGALRWEESLGAWGPITAADVDGDGAEEILFSAETGLLYCLGHRAAPTTGSHIRWAMEFDGVPGQAVFADIRGKRTGDILVPAADGLLYCLTAS